LIRPQQADIPERHWSMISLKHDRPGRLFILKRRRARWALELDVFVDDFPIVNNFDEGGIGRLFARGVKARGAKTTTRKNRTSETERLSISFPHQEYGLYRIA
jgi:hypothetical protein